MNQALLTVGLMLVVLGSIIVGLLITIRPHREQSMQSHWRSTRRAFPGVAKEYRP